MVALGMLLGCDYTTGVKGVGIVNAMEILDAFPAAGDKTEDELLSGLRAFRDWHAQFDPVAEALSEANKSPNTKPRKKTNKRPVAAAAAASATVEAPVAAAENNNIDEESDVQNQENNETSEADTESKSARERFEKKHQNAR
jgi:5'-3' exonuclease